MVKYKEPIDITINTGTNQASLPEFAGLKVVAFGENATFPWRKDIDWVWENNTLTILMPGVAFSGASYHFEFATDTDYPQLYTDVTAVGTNISQYPHILEYKLINWEDENGEPVTIRRRCRCRYTTKGAVQFNGQVAKAVIYLPLPEITIDEGTPVTVYDGDNVYESGMVLQYRKNALNFNQRLWL